MGGGEGRQVYGYIERDSFTVSSKNTPLELEAMCIDHGFSPRNIKVPNGIRYHLIDIYLDELDKLEPADSDDSANSLPIDLLVQPFEQLLEKSPTKVVRTKSKEMLRDGRLEQWGYSKVSQGDEEEKESSDDVEWTGFD